MVSWQKVLGIPASFFVFDEMLMAIGVDVIVGLVFQRFEGSAKSHEKVRNRGGDSHFF